MSEWSDISSYSKYEVTRIPQSWELRAGDQRIVVTRRHGAEGWFLSWNQGLLRLKSIDIDDAKAEACRRVVREVRKFVSTLETAIGEAKP